MQRRVQTPDAPLVFYQKLLEMDSSSLVCGFDHKRQISVLMRLGRTKTAVDELVDTFYTDVEAWLELANLYISLYQYASLPTLDRVTVCPVSRAPQNPFYVFQAAEIACIAEDIPLAIRFFLVAIDMVGDDEESPPPTGIAGGVWFGVELVSLNCSCESPA
ncbi:hypothetical protein EDB92DRAFT_1798707 [Lactarius akahatsu]|uniref:ER membrane protein complex subunit 2 n=1 Tax=Lactarius akahatsu TaxID=416441 RepID=A0AAD4LKK8_9AGAM|nr:hypothetical protein EDB92DRAFT_1798707 [Lactarius akahatsu]